MCIRDSTYNSYVKVCKQFIADTIANHKEVKTFKDCKKYVTEFLQNKEDAGASAWTLAQYGCALASAYNCGKNDFNYDYPVRHRANIKRSRGVNSSDYRYPEAVSYTHLDVYKRQCLYSSSRIITFICLNVFCDILMS